MRTPPRAYALLPTLGLLIACLVLLGSLTTPVGARAATRVHVVRNISVPTTDGARIPIDVWRVGKVREHGRAKGPRLRKVALLIHGGGWHSGDKRQWEQSRWAQRLSINGWIVINANYRLACSTHKSKLCGHAMRDSITDVQVALRYTANHARSWGGDPNRIVLFGASAGGQLAMLAGSDPHRPRGVRAVVAIGPPTNLIWVGRQPTLPLYSSARQSIGCSLDECPDAWQAASPITAIRRSTTPPTWIFNARADAITSIVPVRAYVAQLQQRHIPVQLVTPDNATASCHGPIPCASEQLDGGQHGDMFQHALAWIQRYA